MKSLSDVARKTESSQGLACRGRSLPTKETAGEHCETFQDLPPALQSECKDAVMQLSLAGRLFVRDQKALHRAEPAQVKERLDSGLPVEVVSRLGQENLGEADSRFSSFVDNGGLFSGSSSRSSCSSEEAHQQTVFYSASPLQRWDSLEWVNLDQPGIPGAACLPASGGSVTTSESFESRWRAHAEEQWGVFSTSSRESSASGWQIYQRS
ncbi:MAG: hypothetical protein U0931_11895 [Vulcanimicrobiota bacterium]